MPKKHRPIPEKDNRAKGGAKTAKQETDAPPRYDGNDWSRNPNTREYAEC